MTVPSEANKSGPYNGNGATTVFDYDFRIVSDDHIRVILTDADGVETTLTKTADYSVSGVGDANGGSVTLVTPPATGETLTILRSVPFVQETDLENQGAYYAETIEDALDLSVMRDQQMAEEISRAVKIPASSDADDLDGLVGDILRLAASADAVDTVAANIGDVNTVATNMPEIQAVAEVAETISTIVDDVVASAEAAAASAQEAEGYAQEAAQHVASVTPDVMVFSGDGSETEFDTEIAVLDERLTNVYISGVYQQKSTYSVVDGVITFTSAPPAGSGNIEVMIGGNTAQAFAIPSNGAVVESKLSPRLSARVGAMFDTVSDLLADAALDYVKVAEGDYVHVSDGGFDYEIAASGAADFHVETAGGVKLYVLVGEDGFRPVRAFGGDPLGLVDAGEALEKALSVGGSIKVDGVFISDRELLIDAKTTYLYFPTFQQDRIKIGPNFPAGGTLLTVKDTGRRRGGAATEQPYFTGNERFFSSRGLFLDGDGRAMKAHGLYIAGQVDDLSMIETAIHDFKGTGVRFGDFRETEFKCEFRESMLHSLHVKNCGDITLGDDYAAVEFGLNDFVGAAGGINNINLYHIKVIYPRGMGLRFKSLAVDSSSMRRINFEGLFVHGNRSLVGDDPNGEAWLSGRGLVEIGHDGATSNQNCNVKINNLSLIEQEEGQDGMVVYDGSQLFVNGFYASCSDTRRAFKFDGAGPSALLHYFIEQVGVGSLISAAGLIEVLSMQSQATVTVASISGPNTPTGSPNYIGELNYLHDLGKSVSVFSKTEADSAAADAKGSRVFGDTAQRALYINRIRLIPYGNLTADDTNYATLTLQRRNEDGSGNNVSLFRTQTEVSGGTGDWVAGTEMEIAITNQQRIEIGGMLQLAISKQGTGVIVPEFALIVEMSSNISAI